MNVGVVGTRVANYGSLITSLRGLDVQAVLTEDPEALDGFDALIIPGVGHFGYVMRDFTARGVDQAVRRFCSSGRSVLGICLGMQLLFDSSSEAVGSGDDEPGGLGLIPGRVAHLSSAGCAERLPHIGWNNHSFVSRESRLMRGIDPISDFYFVHSYHAVAESPSSVAAKCDYGIDFVSAVEAENIFGTQFHPEKSSRPGMHVLQNFVDAARC